MREVRRDDGELCGFVAEQGGRWQALTVFGVALADHGDADEATAHVRAHGLAVLADCWTLVDTASGEEQVVRILQASPTEVTLALDFYALPGVPTLVLAGTDLTAGRWRLQPPT